MSTEHTEKKYYFWRRTGIFLVLLTITSVIYAHVANGNQLVADVSLLVLLAGCYGLKAR